MRASILIVSAALLATSTYSEAQVTRIPPPTRPAARRTQPKIHVNIDAGLTAVGSDVDQSFTIVKNAEDSTFDTVLTQPSGVLVDLGGWVELSPAFGAGVSFSALSRDAGGTIEGSIAHPFYFDQRRTVAGDFDGLSSKELGVHIDAIGNLRAGRKLMLNVFGGPSILSLEQTLVTDVEVDETYPYDTATLKAVITEVVKKTGIGFNAGTGVTLQVKPNVGVGAMVRFVAGTLKLASSAGDIDYQVKSLRISGGVRLTF